MESIRIALLYGGRSGEHEISIRSAKSIYAELKKKHKVFPIFIDKQGCWWRAKESEDLPTKKADLDKQVFFYPGFAQRPSLFTTDAELKIDIAFPVLHGTHGEDGIIQGVLESAGIPYIGAGVSASAVGMDKALMKALFVQHQLPVAPFLWFYRYRWRRQEQRVVEEVERSLPYPVFVKPANLGSSVGINKARDRNQLKNAMDVAAKYDSKIMVEQGINARELECSVLGNHDPKTSVAGEIIPKREFYDYAAKYIEDTTELVIPAKVDAAELRQVQELSVGAFQAIGCSGMARVDLFLERETGRIFLNEINTIPGFTNISMYPKLWEASGLSFGDLLDRLLQLGLERFQEQAENVTSYEA